MFRYGKYQLMMIAVLIIVVLLPLASLAAVNFTMSLSNAKEQTERYSRQLLEQTMNEHGLMDEQMKNMMFDMLGNMDHYYAVMDEYYTNTNTLGFLKEMEQRIGIHDKSVLSIYLVDLTNRKAYSSFDNRLQPFASFYDQAFLRQFDPSVERSGIRYWTRNIYKENESALELMSDTMKDKLAQQREGMMTYYMYVGHSGNRVGVIAVNLRLDFLRARGAELKEKTGGTLFVTDFRNELLFRADMEWTADAGTSVEIPGKQQGLPAELDSAGEHGLKLSMRHQTSKFEYTLLIPQAAFADRVYRQTASFIVIGILAAAFSLAAVFAASRYLYRPISGIVQLVGQAFPPRAEKLGQAGALIMDEPTFIRQTIDRFAGEQQIMKEAMRKHRETIKQHLLDKILMGQLRDTLEELRRFGIRLDFTHFTVISVQLQGRDDAAGLKGIDSELIRYAIGNIAEETLRSPGYAFACLKDKETVSRLLNSPGELPSQELVELCGALQTSARGYMHVQLDIGIGGYRSDVGQVWQSYRESLQSLAYSKLMDWGVITLYSELERMEAQGEIDLGQTIEWEDYDSGYIRAVKLADKERLAELFASIREEAKEKRISSSAIQRFTLQFLASLTKLYGEYRFGGSRWELESLFDKLAQRMRFSELLAHMERLTGQFVALLEGKRAYINRDLAERAIQTIRSDLSLTVEAVADSVSLSSPSLNKLIREYLGMSTGEFIVKARIEKAKELLERTESKIEEIAGLTGYATARGFYKIFKEVTGMTPSEYRKLTTR
jgi:two-component system response regulator YesN